MKLLFPWIVLCRHLAVVLTLGTVVQHAGAQGKAHAHGVASINIALEGRTVSVELSVPLHDLIGFERAPRTPPEHQRVAAMAAKLRETTLFGLSPAAQCQPTKVSLVAPVLGWPSESAVAIPAHNKEPDHADLDGQWEFDCLQPALLTQLNVALFDAFAKLHRVEVQLVLAKGQRRDTLRRPAQAIRLD